MFLQKSRQKEGNVLIIVLIVICFILVPLLVVISQTGFYVIDRDRVQSSVDAAGLVAANDLSRIIINDENFGWVSLSNYPPIGRATCARDGEPLPVTGINTLVGTIRQNTIIASVLGNTTMRHLAETDRKAMQATIDEINNMIKSALAGKGRGKDIDIHGAKVDPARDAHDFLASHLPNNVRLESMTLTNGWLEGGGMTTIGIPQPEQFGQVKPDEARAGNYKAFIDIPAEGKSFTFAGLGPSSRLVSNSEFRPADGKHINTIVKIDCVLSRQNPLLPFLPTADPKSKFRCVAYCQPFTQPDVGPKGLMTLRFSGQPVPGLLSWKDFLTEGNFRDRQVTTYDVVGGDFPVDKGSALNRFEPMMPAGTAQQFAEHLYYWLRNGHLQPKLGAVLDMVNAPFKTGLKDIYAYEFARDGSISHRVLERDPFPPGVTADSQLSSMADTRIQGGLAPIIIFRDNVKNLGTEHGGKHGGQPIAGYPLNWCELREFGGDEHIAMALGKGKLGTQLMLTNPDAAEKSLDQDGSSINLFQKLDGKDLTLQPRRTFYSGGLALDIEIGGIRDFQPSTLDIPSKRKFWGHRRI